MNICLSGCVFCVYFILKFLLVEIVASVCSFSHNYFPHFEFDFTVKFSLQFCLHPNCSIKKSLSSVIE